MEKLSFHSWMHIVSVLGVPSATWAQEAVLEAFLCIFGPSTSYGFQICGLRLDLSTYEVSIQSATFWESIRRVFSSHPAIAFDFASILDRFSLLQNPSKIEAKSMATAYCELKTRQRDSRKDTDCYLACALISPQYADM